MGKGANANGFWHGASCLSKTFEDASANRCYFRDAAWESISASEQDRNLAQNLDKPSPPPRLTRILKKGESWDWQTEVTIRFEDNPKSYKVPWREMKELNSPLWLRVSFELWPFNVETFRPNLAAILQKRWRRYGKLLIGERSGQIHLARFASEPIEVEWLVALPNQF